jgi:hypothetical protein
LEDHTLNRPGGITALELEAGCYMFGEKSHLHLYPTPDFNWESDLGCNDTSNGYLVEEFTRSMVRSWVHKTYALGIVYLRYPGAIETP